MHFSAAEWHRARRRSILKDHPEARALIDGGIPTRLAKQARLRLRRWRPLKRLGLRRRPAEKVEE